jgi:hypothetical protein
MSGPPNPFSYPLEQVDLTEQEMVAELERLSHQFRKDCRKARAELGRRDFDQKGYRRLIGGSRSCIQSSRELLSEVNERLKFPKS